jgi:3-methyl-2-oxobutanoate hydroxymethyltransferase
MYPDKVVAAKGNKKISMITAYDYSMAKIIDKTDIDMILVGDSLGNVVLGHKDTIAVTLNDMIHHGSAVVKGAKNKIVIVDMPFMSLSMGIEKSLENVMYVMQQTGCHGVKIEGGSKNIELVKRLNEEGVPVMGHLGLTPQSYLKLGGYKKQGFSKECADKILEDAIKLTNAGVFSIVLECIEESLAKKTTEEISVPTIGIGSGNDTDGQVLVINDLIGLNEGHVPSFVKAKLNLKEDIKKALNEYVKEVRG